MDFKTLLQRDFIIMDGAFGTEIQRLKKEPFAVPDILNFTDPELIINITKSYINSGSDIVCANTFGANRYKLKKHGKNVGEVIACAVELAKKAAEGTDTLIALDVTTLGQLIEPIGTLKFEEAYEAYKEIMTAGEKSGADLVLLETTTDLYESKAAILALKENTNLPVICSMTFEKNQRTFTGCCIPSMAMTLEGLGADAIGINCSVGPSDLFDMVKELLEWTSLPVMIKPNAGLPDPVSGKFSLSADDFAEQMVKFAEIGVQMLGGCCGTTPEYIKILREKLSEIKPNRPGFVRKSAVCTPSVAVVINSPKIIGERINPTGKKRFKEALINNDIDYILGQATEQVNAGADILDVNVGLPEIDEREMMIKTIKALQSITDVPLQIDSTKPEVIEAALRVYNGKAIVNSVNGEDEVLTGILPVVKKYGAAVIGLTLDKNGIPKTAQERFEIAEKILEKALSYGIPKEDVYIDCLTLTISAEQENAYETLKAVKMVRERLGLQTVLGVSNISFGLPHREFINHTFLAIALENGLTLPIINPNAPAMTGTVRAYNALKGLDVNSSEYIKAYSESTDTQNNSTSAEMSLEYAIRNGLKSEGAKITERLLKICEPMAIVTNELIPALDKIGIEFEKGTLYLPQLILAAEVSGVCFEVIKNAVESSGKTTETKGEIIMATVKGDIHDIGKNIVKTLLENYGYKVYDLGKDVPEQLIADEAEKRNIKLVGLSALMTTTLPSMEKTIKLIREKGLNCKVMVGGAVLNQDYADKIGADYYAKDAKGAVDIAKAVFE